MAILKLDEHLYISPQLTKADAEQIAQLGIKTVICNRPDREEESQPDFAQIKQWLEQARRYRIPSPTRYRTRHPKTRCRNLPPTHRTSRISRPCLLPDRYALLPPVGLPPGGRRYAG